MPNQTIYPIRIELPFVPDSKVNVYLLPGPEPVLIDAGYNSDECWDALKVRLAQFGLTPGDLSRVIITHPHVDHYGLAARIANAGQAEIWMCETGVEWLRNFAQSYQRRIDYHRDQLLPGLGISAEGQTSFLQWMDFAMRNWEPIPDQRIRSFPFGEAITLGGQPWQVIHTPGHDAAIVVFQQIESKQLLASDALLIPTATPVVEAPMPGLERQPSLPTMLISMRKLAEMDVETVYPGHGKPFSNHKQVVEAQITRIHQRKEEALRYIGGGVTSVAELFQRMYSAPATVMGMAGLWMALGYVDLLVEEERVRMESVDGVWRLHPV